MKLPTALAFALALAAGIGAQLAPIAGPGAPSFATGRSSIEGTVINEVTHEPVRKAQVTLGAANVAPAVTDATGRFAFRNLAPGAYWVQASHTQFPPPTSAIQRRLLNITLGQDEQKRDLVILLTPGAVVVGSVLDEDGKPLFGCYVQALEFQIGQPDRKLSGRNSAASDSRGQYRISSLPAGRYYLMVQCQQTLPAPHPLIRMGPDVFLPQQRYTVEFYPGPPNTSGTSRLTLAAGADLRGIDFQVRATQTVTVRGRLGGELEALRHNPWVQLVPRDPMIGNLFQYGGMVDTRRNSFRIDGVPPGSYTLLAIAQDETHAYQAKIPMDIGTETPAPIELAFLPGSSFNGSVELPEDPPQALENAHVRLIPMDASFSSSPFAKVDKDRTFALSGVMPGRWRLQLENFAGYVKSFMIGDRPTSPHGFNIGPGSGGTMRVVIGAKFAQVEGTVTGTKPEGAMNVWLMMSPDDPDQIAVGRLSVTAVEGAGHFTLTGIEPGKYHLYAFAGVEPGMMQQSPTLLKALEDRGVQLDLEEGAHATPEVPIIPAEDILRAIEEQQ